MDEQGAPTDVEASPLLGGSSASRRRAPRWPVALAAAATLGAIAVARSATMPRSTTSTLAAPRAAGASAAAAPLDVRPRSSRGDALPPSTADLIKPPKGIKPIQMGHFGKWTVMASSRKMMDETADALWWGLNMMERFRDYAADPAFPSYSYLGPTGCSNVQRRWLSLKHQPTDDEMHVVWNSGNEERNTASVNGRTLSLSAQEVFASIRTLHSQTALQENQFSGQRLGVFDVTGIERAVWGARDNLRKFGWPYRLLKGTAVVQDQNTKSAETDLYVVRTLTGDGKILETTAVSCNSDVAREAFARVPKDAALRYPVKLPAWQFGSTSCGSDKPYIFCGQPRFNQKLFLLQTEAGSADYFTDEADTGVDGLVNITRSAHTHVASTDPMKDALFLRKWLKHEPLTDFPDTDDEAWVSLPLEQADGVSKYTNHYVHLTKPTGLSAELPGGQGELSLSDFEGFVRYLREQKGGLDYNNYDPFLDEHVGIEGCHSQIPAVASTLLAMHEDGVQMLTRRELVADRPDETEERFSVFFDLPASTYAFQLRVNGEMSDLKDHGLPEFCDWDFCRDEGFGNYREPDALYMDPTVCGFSAAQESTLVSSPGDGRGDGVPLGPVTSTRLVVAAQLPRHHERLGGARRVPGARGIPPTSLVPNFDGRDTSQTLPKGL